MRIRYSKEWDKFLSKFERKVNFIRERGNKVSLDELKLTFGAEEIYNVVQQIFRVKGRDPQRINKCLYELQNLLKSLKPYKYYINREYYNIYNRAEMLYYILSKDGDKIWM